jgi:pyridoxamine 5'-phosphate oxidase
MSRSADTYMARQAPDYFGAADPFVLFEAWFGEARQHEPNDPNAMSVATVDASGMPNVRIVLLKGLDDAARGPDRGFVFYTNHEGAKGRELLASGKTALNFHWKSLNRQVRIRGTVAVVAAAEADAYYATRARGSQIGAWASQQSRPLETRAQLEDAVKRYEVQFGDGAIQRPAYWSGFRVTPLSIEFWHDRPFRLHDRLVFQRAHVGDAFATARLSP